MKGLMVLQQENQPKIFSFGQNFSFSYHQLHQGFRLQHVVYCVELGFHQL